MTLKTYLTTISICTGICWIVFLTVLGTVNPLETKIWGLLIFYITLLIALIGSFSLIGFVIRCVFNKQEIWYKTLNIASRQALILSVLVIVALIFQSFRYLYWWNLIILVIIAFFVELFVLAQKRSK